MSNSQLENYLTKLDKALGPVSVSARAEIITEIKSHIIEAQDRDPQKSLQSILDALGEPETVANRYLLERGLKPVKPPKTSMIKWLTIGFLGMMGICSLTLLFIIWHFSPLIQVDDKNQHVRLLGGAIEVDGKTETVRVGTALIEGGLKVQSNSGDLKVDRKNIKDIQIPFTNGKITLNSAVGENVHWDCKTVGEASLNAPVVQKSSLIFDLAKFEGIKCELSIPEHLKSVFKGSNGKLIFEKPKGDVDVQLLNGKISFAPDEHEKYRYNLHMGNGKIDTFTSSDDPNAIQINMNIGNGRIDRE